MAEAVNLIMDGGVGPLVSDSEKPFTLVTSKRRTKILKPPIVSPKMKGSDNDQEVVTGLKCDDTLRSNKSATRASSNTTLGSAKPSNMSKGRDEGNHCGLPMKLYRQGTLARAKGCSPEHKEIWRTFLLAHPSSKVAWSSMHGRLALLG